MRDVVAERELLEVVKVKRKTAATIITPRRNAGRKLASQTSHEAPSASIAENGRMKRVAALCVGRPQKFVNTKTYIAVTKKVPRASSRSSRDAPGRARLRRIAAIHTAISPTVPVT